MHPLIVPGSIGCKTSGVLSPDRGTPKKYKAFLPGFIVRRMNGILPDLDLCPEHVRDRVSLKIVPDSRLFITPAAHR